MTDLDSCAPAVLEIVRSDLAIPCTETELDAELLADLGFDSIAFAIGRVAIHERLGVLLTEEQVHGCRTVRDIVDIVDGSIGVAKLAEESHGA
ncbi:phosphopantetheine-binding protein [Aldersonia sp. NBC_00410]|uniref:phosphopantetheine-binding protein n=1 Tax=Aldersonia sp. NBC_00410 TaxID=2975954 RepID=UPI002254EDAA|nr:phosphopantetheine-binding protein [Aldersonia sp. NBC_00410]MCX5041645.1 phosphopantetheine-binding protein [Aldersonia sp. NBC_00410]